MYTMLIINSLMMSMIFITLNHPISLGFILLIQTILISLITSYMTFTFWMSYILFLVMVGGMLILFTYVTSIASNETFNLSNKLVIMNMMFLLMMNIFLLMDNSLFYQLFKINDMIQMTEQWNNINEFNIVLNKIYNKPNLWVSILLINYLLLALIVVVKITNFNYGPLRQKF
uniref:NADH-ubiquinone oxidoreductase chain 6 n=1 Tax=Coleoptera sp. ACP-2013 TaxID=2485033 RepID=A0A3G3MET1_9COLE|nr:NADH dehydrogenase subunit 6 [Coleoptera sp. ACP-2013]